MAEQMIPISDVPDRVEARTGWKPSIHTIRDWAGDGKITARKIGGSIFVELDSVFGLFPGKEGQDR
jgi:hypothetical protein